ncbi:protein kinase [endosymbiont GvMRE of Glomus versiforme]|uniref:protein kinase n=1 Tax=endosymbiont GvMRE of Glomus versiforme TaxID=2039283 RepID=UPI000EDF8AC8|nr:protein kinase [endosymbiont GvMRE of Glomus versiforme]RHZ35942.1 Cdc15p [endosymbiont GvMRE of Glomus versiforme]
MTNDWKDIHEDFTPELQQEWENKGFNYEQVKDWASAWGGKFNPQNHEFFFWLSSRIEEKVKKNDNTPNLSVEKSINKQDVSDHTKKEDLIQENLYKNREKNEIDKEKVCREEKFKLLTKSDTQDQKNVHSKLTPRLQELWEGQSYTRKELRFTVEQTQKWISKGFTPMDYDLVRYLKKKKGYNPKQRLNLTELRKEYKSNLNWENIYEWFKYHQKKWKKAGLTYTEAKQWIEAGLNYYDDYKLAIYLKQKGHQPIDLNIEEVIKKESWKDIHPEFGYLDRKGWEGAGFSYEKAKQWIKVGFRPKEYEKAEKWKKNLFTLSQTQEWIDIGLSTGELKTVLYLKQKGYQPTTPNIRELKVRYQKFGMCRDCKQPNTGDGWGSLCQFCNAQHFQNNFKNWTSGNQDIDQFIQKYQLNATDPEKVLEWIPYCKLTNIEYLAEGGFGRVYKAKWDDGYIYGWKNTWDEWRKKWQRKGAQIVVLKSLNNSQNMTNDFLREITHHKLFDNLGGIVKCYGISQDPVTKDYAMVMQYVHDGDLRQYLNKNYGKLNFEDKFLQLHYITKGLNSIHERGLIHKDLHAGNILNSINACYITDLGLCRPANEANDKTKVFGVLSYIAPEVLCGNPYTQAADIYSWGIVAYELFSGLPPYCDIAHNKDLAEIICRGIRPNLGNVQAPQLLKDLISRCWDADPLQRPTANELDKTLWDWWRKIGDKTDTEGFSKQLKKTKELNKTLVSLVPTKTHSQAIYTSRLLDFKNLPTPQNNLSQEWQTSTLLELQIKAVEEEINLLKKSHSESAELIENFIQNKKKSIKDEKDEKARNEIKASKKELEKKGFSTENLGEIIRYCEKLVDLEHQGEKEQKKRQLSHDSQVKTAQGNFKSSKLIEAPEYQTEPMKIDTEQITSTGITEELSQLNFLDWANIHSNFVPQLIQAWQNHNFTYEQTRDWINIHAPANQIQAIQEPAFYAYLRDEVKLTPEQILNDNTIDLNELRGCFHQYQQGQQQTQIIHQPWTNN